MADEGGEGREEAVRKFREVTGVDEERAEFFLEASAWQLPVAMASFFEGVEAMEDEGEISPPPTSGARGTTTTLPPVLPPTTTKQPVKPPPRSGGMMTMDALRQQREAEEEDSSDDDEKKQAFYAGGSTTSGQQVLGPASKRNDIIAEMFKKAREQGAEEVEAEAPQLLKKKASSSSTFGGVGYKLGETETEAATVVGTTGGAPGPVVRGGTRDVVLRLWAQGFTVDGGEVRSYQDPINLTFLSSVKRGEVPRELIREFQGQEVSLTMEDRRTEDYAPPKPVLRPFAGKGNMLGSPAPSTVSSGATGGTAGGIGLMSDRDREANESQAREGIRLREGEGRTNIQLRLADGTRLVAQFNPSHTVNDLHSFINVARPEYSSLNYVLALFPSTELTEKSLSLKDANVLNSALVQKLKH